MTRTRRGPCGGAARTVAAGAILFLCLGGATLAQSDPVRTLQRPSEVLGLPGLNIDLTRPATQRLAIVIGNGSYDHAPSLPNAVADAQLVADVLRSSGYAVLEYHDLDKRGFEEALRRMMFETGKGADVVIYYAGHGVQIGNSNRLIPTDAEIADVYDLPFETVSLSSLLSIAGSRSRSLVVILDSCRDNPFPGRDAIVGLDSVPQDLRTGFAAQDSPVNSLIVFSTSPGAVALDGSGGHSPFTQALYDTMSAQPDAPFAAVLQEVRHRVYAETNGQQVPWESSSLIETLRLDADPGVPGFQNPAASASPALPAGGTPIAVTLPLDRKVAVGPALTGLAGPDSREIMLARAPQLGRIEIGDAERYRGLSPLVPVSGTVAALVYTAGQPNTPALSMAGPVVTDSFVLTSGSTSETVNLTLNVDPCDYQAGDHLDPDGVGVARYPNEIEPEAALAACQAAVERAPEVGRFHYELGRVHLAMRDLAAAGREFERARDLGHTRAWHALGMLEIARSQELGGLDRGMAPDKALALLAMGVDRGDPYAFHSLGLQLLRHGTTAALRRQGFDLLSRAQEVGHTFAMNALGQYFLEKDSDHFDPQRGLRYLRESALRGDIYGYDSLGALALGGTEGMERDPKVALDWFRKASDQGHPTAPTSIGRMYFNGDIGGGPDFAAAVEWYDIGLTRGDAWGGANAAWVIANRAPAGFGPGDAAVRAAKAASLRNAEAAQVAMAVIDALPASALDAGAQVLLGELGEPVTADGDFGEASRAALARVAARHGATLPDDRKDRLMALAALYWTTNKFRVDLY